MLMSSNLICLRNAFSGTKKTYRCLLLFRQFGEALSFCKNNECIRINLLYSINMKINTIKR